MVGGAPTGLVCVLVQGASGEGSVCVLVPLLRVGCSGSVGYEIAPSFGGGYWVWEMCLLFINW